MEDENQKTLKLATFGELFVRTLNYSIRLFPKAFGVLIVPGVCVFVCFFVGTVLLFLIQKFSGLSPLIILLAFIFAVGFYFVVWLHASLITIVVNMDAEIRVKEAIKTGWKMVLPLLSVYIWSILIVGGGILFFIIPGILFVVWFSLSPFALFCENMRGRRALLRSKYLIKGYWWNVFGRLSVLFFIGIIVFAGLDLLEKKLSVFNLFWLIFNVVINVFWPLFLFVFLFLIYKNLSEIKESMPEDFAGFPNNWLAVVLSILGVVVIVGYLGALLFLESDRYKELIIKSREGSARGNALILMSAINVYYGDNEGVFPKTLDELIPKYIKEIPKITLGDKTWAGDGKNTWKLDPTPLDHITEADIDNSTTWIYNNEKGLITINKTGLDLKGVPYSEYGNPK